MIDTTLIEQLRDLDRNVRSRAALDLGKLDDVNTLDALLNALCTEWDFFVREDITWALVRFGEAAVSPLIALLSDPNPATRHYAAHTLGKIGDARAVDALVHALRDDDAAVVSKAAFALGQIGDERVIGALVDQLGHEHREVQSTLVTVLEGFGEAAVSPLMEAVSNEQPQIRELAVDILGLIGSGDAVPVLIDALRDEQWEVRFAAVTALGQIGGTEAKNALRAMENDPDYRVRGVMPKLMRRIKV